jgi:phosphate-selective porin OprO/OprP
MRSAVARSVREISILSLLLGLCIAGRAAAQSADEVDDEEEGRATAGFNGTTPFIRSKDGALVVGFGGRVQLDYRAYSDEPAADDPEERATPPDTFIVRRARFEVEGTLYKDEKNPRKDLYFEFKIQADFADVESTLLRDGYLNLHFRDDLQVMAGQFKPPFSQESIQSSKYMYFVERSMLNNIVPARSPGVMVHGTTGAGVFGYEVSYQNGRDELGLNLGARPDFFARARFKPWSSGPFEKLFFGGAIGLGDRDEETLIVGRTSSRSIVFFADLALDGRLTRRNLEAAWFHRNLVIEAEYDDAVGQRLGLGEGGADLPDLEGGGFLVQGLYVLTGENESSEGIVPRRPLQDHGPGAWEVGFRYQQFEVDDGAGGGNLARDYTIGVNWWMNEFLRFQANFVVETFRRPPADFLTTSSLAGLTRMQVHF